MTNKEIKRLILDKALEQKGTFVTQLGAVDLFAKLKTQNEKAPVYTSISEYLEVGKYFGMTMGKKSIIEAYNWSIEKKQPTIYVTDWQSLLKEDGLLEVLSWLACREKTYFIPIVLMPMPAVLEGLKLPAVLPFMKSYSKFDVNQPYMVYYVQYLEGIKKYENKASALSAKMNKKLHKQLTNML